MKAVRFTRHGKPDVLAVEEIADPVPAGDEAVIRVVAASVNPSDVKNVQGLMEQTTLPRTPGRDFAGVVEAGPADWIGAEVWGTGGDSGFTRDGSHAEYILVPAAILRRKPDTLDFDQAGCVGVNFITAWKGLIEAAALPAGSPANELSHQADTVTGACRHRSLARAGARLGGVVRIRRGAARRDPALHRDLPGIAGSGARRGGAAAPAALRQIGVLCGWLSGLWPLNQPHNTPEHTSRAARANVHASYTFQAQTSVGYCLAAW